MEGYAADLGTSGDDDQEPMKRPCHFATYHADDDPADFRHVKPKSDGRGGWWCPRCGASVEMPEEALEEEMKDDGLITDEEFRRAGLGVPSDAASCYVALLPRMREAARAHGYALAVHGSMERDLDVIAAPWTEDAADAQTLVDAIKGAVNGFLIRGRAGRDPTPKPHGRLAWSIHLGADKYVDLSVMPRLG